MSPALLSAPTSDTHGAREPGAPEAHQPASHQDIAHTPLELGYWPMDRPFPALLTPGDLMLVFSIKRSQFYKLQKLTRFRFLEASRPHVTAAIYSGAKVAAYCEGRTEFGFGRKAR